MLNHKVQLSLCRLYTLYRYSVKNNFFQSSPFIVSQLLLLWTTSVVTKYPFNPGEDIFLNFESQQCLLQIILLLSFTFPER